MLRYIQAASKIAQILLCISIGLSSGAVTVLFSFGTNSPSIDIVAMLFDISSLIALTGVLMFAVAMIVPLSVLLIKRYRF